VVCCGLALLWGEIEEHISFMPFLFLFSFTCPKPNPMLLKVLQVLEDLLLSVHH